LKAGALDVVTRKLEAMNIPPLEKEVRLARLAKHQHPLDPRSTTLRYIRSLPAIARLLGTGETTALL
jgi:hypothetical protein